ncbi:MAG: pentapeptide repeat-containing protein [Lachnospiraceae bacterium]|nr:pentapeptide repeat-containing protein [Lachnospiraceae bacterium]
MIDRKVRSERFRWGFSILDAYLYYNGKENFHDINIVSENFFSDLLNILYGYELVNANKIRMNTAGYDLIDTKNRLLIQVSSSAHPQKVKDTLEKIEGIPEEKKKVQKEIEELKRSPRLNQSESEKLENLQKKYNAFLDFTGYTVKFMFLKRKDKLSEVEKYKGRDGKGYKVPSGVSFDRAKDIICLDDLTHEVEYLSEVSDVSVIDRLDAFMIRNRNLFERRIDPPEEDGVQEIIREYYDNYMSSLFLHTYSPNSDRVTLKNLYVEPNYNLGKEDEHEEQEASKEKEESSLSSVELFSDFIWGRDEDRFLFIDGDAAVGKTSLVSWLCYHYIEQDNEGRAIFCDRKMVCIRLRELTQEQLSGSIEKCILDYLHVKNRKEFDNNYKDAVFVLDGADEIRMVANVSVHTIEHFLLGIRRTFKWNRIICTSRPKFINMQIFQKNEIGFRVVTIEHFNKRQRESWLKQYKDTGETVAGETEAFICNLNNKTAGGVADTPLALYLLVACKIREDIKDNQWALYNEIFHNAIIHTHYNENLKNETGHPTLEDGIGEEVYGLVGEIAFAMFRNSGEDRYYITSAELDHIIDRHEFACNSRELVKRACVLCAYWKKNSKKGALEFYHNDIRDFFFSEFIYNELMKLNDLDGREYIENLIKLAFQLFKYGYVAETTWEQTFLLLYLRMRYYHEKKYLDTQFDAVKVRKNYAKIISSAVHGSIDVGSGSSMFTYEAYKRAFINLSLLLKSVMIGAMIEEEPTFWIDEKEKEEWEQSDLLCDWSELFTMGVSWMQPQMTKYGWGVDKGLALTRITFASFSDWSGFSFSKSRVRDAVFFTDKLEQVSFAGKDLKGACFANSILTEVDFSGADLSLVQFNTSLLRDCRFLSSEIGNCHMHMVDIYRGDFPNGDFFGINNSKVEDISLARGTRFHNMWDCHFYKCSIPEGYFLNRNITGCYFITCELHDGTFQDAAIKGSVFSDCRLQKSSMNRTVFDKCRFSKCDFSKADLLNASFSSCTFIDCMFTGTSMQETHLTECVFDEISLNNLKYSRAYNWHAMKYTVRGKGNEKEFVVSKHRFRC